MGLIRDQDYSVLVADYKPFTFIDGGVWIYINDTLMDINTLIPKTIGKALNMFYVYLSKDKEGQKNEVIRQIRSIV